VGEDGPRPPHITDWAGYLNTVLHTSRTGRIIPVRSFLRIGRDCQYPVRTGLWRILCRPSGAPSAMSYPAVSVHECMRAPWIWRFNARFIQQADNEQISCCQGARELRCSVAGRWLFCFSFLCSACCVCMLFLCLFCLLGCRPLATLFFLSLFYLLVPTQKCS